MLKIGLTGNIGSGKSTVAAIFRVLGIPVYHADEASKAFLEDEGVKQEIVLRFGEKVLQDDGAIDRKALAAIVFSDPQALKELNEIMHPRVREDFRRWISGRTDARYVVKEAAIIFESGFRAEYDYIIHVSCPKEKAIDRVVKRDKVDSFSVKKRMVFQLDNEEKSRLSDFVIINDDSVLIIPQVLSIHYQLLETAANHKEGITARES